MSDTDFESAPDRAAPNPGFGDSPTATSPHASAPAAAARPDFIPEKFWDRTTGQVRIEALAKSYRALERRLGAGAHRRANAGLLDAALKAQRDPDASSGNTDDDRFEAHRFDSGEFEADRAGGEDDSETDRDGERAGNGESPDDADMTDADDSFAASVPESPEDYVVALSHPWIERDAALDQMLHAGGFTQAQAQLVYDLAAERVVPVIEALAAEYERRLGEAKLEAHFGGRERYTAVARQLRDWGQRNLPKALFEQLSGSPDGIVALHRMMRGDSQSEPRFLSGAAGAAPTQAELEALVRDPRYWRDHDPALIRRVEEGFKRLYPGN